MARFEDVRTIVVGPTAPKGEAARGASAGASFHASLGENAAGEGACGAETARAEGLNEAADGLNVVAFALSILGDAAGEPDDE